MVRSKAPRPLRRAAPRKEHHRTNGKAPRHFGHALVPDRVSSDVDGFIWSACRGNNKAHHVTSDWLDAWRAVARRSCRDVERGAAICRCKLGGFPRREANGIAGESLSADLRCENLTHTGEKRPAAVVEVVGVLIVAEQNCVDGLQI